MNTGTTQKVLSLSEILMLLDGGATVEAIKDKIRRVSDAVMATGKQGTVTIKLQFNRNGSEDVRQLKIRDSVTSIVPEATKAETLVFLTEDGDLTRQNPNQPTFAGMS